jgi:hypothetical protein
MHIALSTRPSISSAFALSITLMVITSVLGSYPWTYHLMFQLAPYGLAIVPLFLLFPLLYCSQNSTRLCLLLYIKAPSWLRKALSLT